MTEYTHTGEIKSQNFLEGTMNGQTEWVAQSGELLSRLNIHSHLWGTRGIEIEMK
jgi:hypothetical protein